MERTAVVDAHNDLRTSLQIGNARIGRDRQGLMRRRRVVHIVEFARRRFLAVEFLAAPATNTALIDRAVIGNGSVDFAEYRVRTATRLGKRLDLRTRVRSIEQAVRRLVARAVILVITASPRASRR